MSPYDRGYLAALRHVRKWLDECVTRNVLFQAQHPKAPRWQRLASKYGALTQQSHVEGLDRKIAKRLAANKRKRRRT